MGKRGPPLRTRYFFIIAIGLSFDIPMLASKLSGIIDRLCPFANIEGGIGELLGDY